MATVAEARRRFRGITGHVAVCIWQREDVTERAKMRKLTVTDAQADEVLDLIDRKWDAEQGVNWDTIDFYTDDVLAEAA